MTSPSPFSHKVSECNSFPSSASSLSENASPPWLPFQSRELSSLLQGETLHCVDNRRPSACTRESHRRVPSFPLPELLASEQVWDCTRHHVLQTLDRAYDGQSRPFLIRLSDVEPDLAALRCAWERHLSSPRHAAFRAVTSVTEGVRIPLPDAWRGRGVSIQHDLDEEPSAQNPVVDFLRQHERLKLSSVWLRIEHWIQARVGSIARRPAFVTGTHPVTTETHFDAYHSLAFVLSGSKTFYVAPPHKVKQTGRKMIHESTAHPHQPGTPREQLLPQPFERINVPAGGLLYLPAGWWHFVESEPKTVMACAWVETECEAGG